MSIISFNDIEGELCSKPIHKDLGLIVTIPCYKEDAILESVQSLLKCTAPECHVDIIILINTPEHAESTVADLNQLSYDTLSNAKSIENMTIIPIHINKIPTKKAGVGLARKLAMDEARRRLVLSENKVKIISCFDADCDCEPNYLTAIYNHFSTSPLEAVSIHYEHPDADLDGKAHERAIYLYELHLRYFIDMQRQINLPFAIHTVGSSMACTARGYQRIGGMNKRKAGEDFYFLQKFIQDQQCDILSSTAVFPSARESDRVPFGTGKAIGDMIAGEENFMTYNAKSFFDLQNLVSTIDDLYHSDDINQVTLTYPISLLEFLETMSFSETLIRLKGNTKTIDTFRKAFFQFFDAFQLMKYLHFVRDKYYPNVDVLNAAQQSLKKQYQIDVPLSELLRFYRELDKRK